MNNFGVIELANAKAKSAPGWAYVPDTGPAPGSAALQPANRKRARNAPGGGPSLGDLTARQEAKVRKEIEALDRDAGRDNTIPVPFKGGRSTAKSTLNVRKIIQSQKTFTNHLDDFIALQAQTENNNNGNGGSTANPSRAGGSQAQANKKAATNRKDSVPPLAKQAVDQDQDVAMADASGPQVLPPPYNGPPASHPGDKDPLLASRVPDMPSDEELRKLLAQPPLSYLEATGDWDTTYPTRVFCGVCGYWGRVRCTKCGTRVCALDCLETHREECVTRYGL